MEIRNFTIRAENEKPILVGRPIVYNSRTDLGDFDEIIEGGALDKSDLSDVKFFINHDTNGIPLARAKAGDENSTMKIAIDKDGLTVSVELDTDGNSEARALYSAVKRGDISGMSFMFSIDDEEWEDIKSEHPVRHIKAIGQVVEVSAVNFPAYDATEISARDKSSPESTMAKNLELELLKAKYLYNI